MSYEALTWAVNEGYERKLEPTKRLILMIMANRADEGGYLYPSMKWLNARTGLDRRTIQRHVAEMTKLGILSRAPAKNDTGSQTSNDWQLSMPKPGLHFEAQGGRHSAAGGAAQRRRGGGTAPPKTKVYTKDDSKPIAQPEGFALVWAAFPKKRSKGAAEKVWKRLNPGPEVVAAMLAAIEALKRTPEWQKDGGQFIPYPATWLNAKGWEDEIPPQDAAHPCWWPGCRHRGLKARGRVKVCDTHLASLERGETP